MSFIEKLTAKQLCAIVLSGHDKSLFQLITDFCKRNGIPLSKGKSVPLQTWSDPEGSRKLRFPDYMTTAQDGGKVVSLTHWPPLPPGNTPGTHLC